MHVVETSLWCDAARARAISFISRADARLGRGRADRVVMTELASGLRRALGLACEEPLLPRYGRPFALGRARVELLPSGASPGGAQLLVELGGWRGLYAGRVGLQPLPGIEPVQLRACDELVLDAPIAGGIVDGREALLRLAGPRGSLHIEPESLETLAAVVGLLGPAHVLIGPRWRKLARSWPQLGLPARGPGRVDGAPPRVFFGARPLGAPSGSLGLGLAPSVADLVRYALETGARRVWVRVEGAPEQVAGARALLSALGLASLAARALAPPEQLTLFPSPPE